MPITLPDLPYAYDALAPHMSEQTLHFHHDKHHNAYVTKTNELIKGSDLETASLEDIMRATVGDSSRAGLFNNAAQVWNHSFFWNCMAPGGGGAPTGDIAKALDDAFGGLDAFKKSFTEAAVGRFGSGWAWLVVNNGKLEITSTPNAGNPLTDGKTPVLTCDVWEHAYYLDYQNRRPDFVGAFLGDLVNWQFVGEQFAKA
jgi:Fe-Mn family superoxide dismutase